MNMDDLIRSALAEAADNMEIDKDKKQDILINVLTQFLTAQLDKKEEN